MWNCVKTELLEWDKEPSLWTIICDMFITMVTSTEYTLNGKYVIQVDCKFNLEETWGTVWHMARVVLVSGDNLSQMGEKHVRRDFKAKNVLFSSFAVFNFIRTLPKRQVVE